MPRKVSPVSRFLKHAVLFPVLTLLSVGHAGAAVVSYAIEDQGRLIPQQAEVGSGKVLVKAAGGDRGQDVLFDATRNVLFVINHRDRSYLVIDERVINEIGALVSSVSGAVENQQGVLADLLGTFGISGEPVPPAASLRDTGQSLTIGGYPCRLFQAHRASALESEVCVADNTALRLADPDFRTLRGFLRFGNHMLNRAGQLLDALGLSLPQVDIADTPGLPIGMHSPQRNLKVRVSAIGDGGDAGGYRIPDGYSRGTIPFTSG